MIFTPKIRAAVRFAIKTHEVDQKQKRKGKDIAYIGHPLTVALILARAGANEDTVCAGVLHDTIEDCDPKHPVTRAMIAEHFGENVAALVMSVTENQATPTWEDRKKEAIEHVKTFSHDSVLVKSGDIISNGTELVDDYRSEGDIIFTRFFKPKEIMLSHYIATIQALLQRWPENPLVEDLKTLEEELSLIAKQKDRKCNI
jgi:myo-inositol-1(or 4)-monophosphatase